MMDTNAVIRESGHTASARRIDTVHSRNGAAPVFEEYTNSTCEDDMSTDSETEVCVLGGYSSSPQDDRVPSSVRNISGRCHDPRARYHVYSSDAVRSSEDDEFDDESSSEYSTTQVGASIEKDAYTWTNGDFSSRQELHANDIQNPQSSKDDDFPSAPPISKLNVTTSRVDSDDLEADRRTVEKVILDVALKEGHKQEILNTSSRTSIGAKTGSDSTPTRLPTFHASSLGPWHGMIAYDACVRVCLHAWAKGCMEAPVFLENECALLRRVFGLQQVLLQSEEELLVTHSSEVSREGNAQKPKKMVGKMKVEVRKVRMTLDPPTGCGFAFIKPPKMETVRRRFSNVQSKVSSGWQAVRNIHSSSRVPTTGSLSRHSLPYMEANTQYIKDVSGLLKVGVSTLRSSSSTYVVQESYSCLLRLKSSAEGDTVRMQPGSCETHTFLPDSLGDDLIVEVLDSKGNHHGRVLAQMATISEDQNEKLRWWSIYREPKHELVGKIQLHINYTTMLDESSLKCGSIAETIAYDLAMEVAMKEHNFQERNLLLHDPWNWLLAEFASYYGVSDSYTKLRYLSYIMDVATPTNDCLSLVYELLLPIIMKGHTKSTLSHQENRILGGIEEQIEQILAVVFENYKSLDELSPSGIIDVFRQPTGVAAPVLEPAVKLYNLLHDILSPEAQNKIYSYFQASAKKRSRRHLTETDEYVVEGNMMDPVTVSTAYQKIKSLCLNIRNEIFTDIQIHNSNILPSFIDLPNLSSAIYSAELCNRLRSFLVTCPPSGPSRPVTDLIIATADFQKDLASWNINPVKGGVDAKELFHLYIIIWIQDKRLSLLETFKSDKVKWSGVRTQYSTAPFVDEIYGRLKETLNDYDAIIRRWPEYTFALENAIVDIEKVAIEALDKQFANVVASLKENLTPKKFGFTYVQKLAKRTTNPYVVLPELGILLNSMKRMLDVLRPTIEVQLKSWGSCCTPDVGNIAAGERLSEVTVMLRSKFRNYVQAIVQKLVENTRLQNSTKLKKILQESKGNVIESEIKHKMQPLTELLTNTVNHLHTIFETRVFIALCRGFWDRMGQDVLSFLENRKENKSLYKGSRVAVSILDDTFASQMQKLVGDALEEKDVEPPSSIVEVRSMLRQDTNQRKNSYFY